ncbi:MAG: hypothetical protein J6D18_01695, partial [Erysipelotrichaceae bacterium]|nr:hypothetical protein [Erysipelotrichaceae bacterium]
MTSRMDEWIRRCEGIPLQTREDLERLQFNKLNRLLRREKDRDGFYQLPSSLSSLEELSSLPFTTSEDIQNHAAGILLGSTADIQKVISDTTSGTTGAEKRIFYSERDLRHTVELFTVGISEMVKERDTVLIGMPYTGPDSLADLIEQAVRGLQAKPVRHSFGSFYEQCDWIHRTRPDSVICFPVWLL